MDLRFDIHKGQILSRTKSNTDLGLHSIWEKSHVQYNFSQPCSFTLKLQFYYRKIKLIIARAPQFKKGNESL